MTVLVTGGSGYVAGWCIRALLDRGVTVRTTLRDTAREARLRAVLGEPGERLEVVGADLLADDGWGDAVRGCAQVLHVASPMGAGSEPADAEELIGPAREGAVRVLRAAADAGAGRGVMTSSCAAATPPAGSEVAAELRERLGPDARRVPRRTLPDVAVRLLARVRPELGGIVPMLGRRYGYDTTKARTGLGWSPRPARTTVVDCARSLVEHGV